MRRVVFAISLIFAAPVSSLADCRFGGPCGDGSAWDRVIQGNQWSQQQGYGGYGDRRSYYDGFVGSSYGYGQRQNDR